MVGITTVIRSFFTRYEQVRCSLLLEHCWDQLTKQVRPPTIVMLIELSIERVYVAFVCTTETIKPTDKLIEDTCLYEMFNRAIYISLSPTCSIFIIVVLHELITVYICSISPSKGCPLKLKIMFLLFAS